MSDGAVRHGHPAQIVPDDEVPVYDVSGLRHETLAGPDQGMTSFEVWRQRVAPGGGTPVHRHDCEEVFVILAGAGTLELEGEADHPFAAGTTVIVPPNHVHRVVNTGAEDLVYLAILGMTPVALETAEGRPVHRPWLKGQAKGQADKGRG